MRCHFRTVTTEYFRGRADGPPQLLNRRRGSWTWPVCKRLLISGSELNYPNDCVYVLQPCKHSCAVPCFHWCSCCSPEVQGQSRESTSRIFKTRSSFTAKKLVLMQKSLEAHCCELLQRNRVLRRRGGKTSSKRSVQRGTCGNLPHTCQEGQHTRCRQKLL